MTFAQLKFLWHADLYRYYGKADRLTFARMLFLYWETPGFRYTFYMRLCSFLFEARPTVLVKPFYVLFRLLLKHYEYKYGIRIAPSTQIGAGFCIGHFGDIGVHPNAVIGVNCNISQGVSIGQASRGAYKGHPTLGDGVFVGPGAKIMGSVYVGNNVAIGANSVVTKDVPDNAVVVGVPGKIISFEGARDYVINTEYYSGRPAPHVDEPLYAMARGSLQVDAHV